ncbi:yop-1 [Symbiodinium sp. CCMP2592]|nr:yop-1 [Symbiodinium sp. CCMP2592]
MIPYIGMVNFAVQYCYPGYETARLLLQDKPSSHQLTQWTFYWMICASFLQLESTLLALVVEYVPLYLEFKTLCLLWLVHPSYKGALWLWHSKLKDGSSNRCANTREGILVIVCS